MKQKKTKKDALFSAKKLRIALAEMGANQAAIARKMGISRAQISHWTAGDNIPSLASLDKLAKAIGKPTNYFFENSGIIADDNSGSVNLNTSDSARLSLVEKDLEIVKKEIEILKLKIKK